MKHGPSTAVRMTLYPLTLLVFIAISTLIVLLALGYDISYKDGHIYTQKTGIIILSTHPGEAIVEIDGQEYGKKTPAINFFRLKMSRIKSGNHTLTVKKDGYESWEGNVDVEAGMVSWLEYLVLIPSERIEEAYNYAGNVESTLVSKDQKRILTMSADRKAGIYNIWQVNTDNKQSEKIAESRLGTSEKIELLELSNNHSRYLYKKTDKDKKISYVVAETDINGTSSNLTNLFYTKADDYQFSPFNDNELYYVSGGNLFKVNISSKTQSAVLEKNVIGIFPNTKKLLMIKKTDDNYGLWEVQEDGRTHLIVKAIPSANNYEVTHLTENKLYLIHNLDDKDLILYGNDQKNPTLETIAKDVDFYSVSPDETRIAIYGQDKLRVYDLEDEEYSETLTSSDIQSVDWMSDSYNLVYRTPKSSRIINYNGFYNKELFPISGPGLLFATENGHNIYFINTINKDTDLNSYSL